MERARRRRGVIWFCLRFLVLVTILMVLWWLLIPVYGAVLSACSGTLLRLLLSVPLDSGEIRADGILNTKSLLVFSVEGRESMLPIAMLVTNVPPYLALVLATLGISWRRRASILLAGTAILFAGHVLFLVYALHFQLAARAAGTPATALGEVPMAIAQLFLTLPFLLWVAFAYWDRIAGYLGEAAGEAH